MKHMKRILALALALMLTLGLATTAFAVEGEGVTEGGEPETPSADQLIAQNGPFTVTINNATGHTYQIYQIFTGDLATKEEVRDGKTVTVEILSNLKYGADYVPSGKTVNGLVADEDLQKAKAFNIVPTGTGTPMTIEGDTAIAGNLAAGYYMIKDTSTNLPAGEEQSAVIFQVVGNTNITSKHTGTIIEKKVQDINDSTGEYTTSDGRAPSENRENTWIDTADYDIGDKVPFKSTSKFEGMANYNTYKVVITDIMAKGLTYNNDMTITINGTPYTPTANSITVTENITTNDEYNSGTQIVVTIENIKGINGVENAAEVILNYSATLNDNANFGASGNPNKIKVSTEPDGTGETPEDVNIVFTYKVNVDKVHKTGEDENGVPIYGALTGAEFTLYKEVPNGSKDALTGEAIKDEFADNVKADALDDDKFYIVISKTEAESDGDTFGFRGVDDGNYVLVETTIPAGYNAWDAKAFTITAAHDADSAAPALTSLTGGDLVSGEFKETGIIDTDIINEKGVELPETGGIGTTIFYVVGGLLAVAAVVLLVTKKRMNTAE